MKKSIKLDKWYEIMSEYHDIFNQKIEYIFIIQADELDKLTEFCKSKNIEIQVFDYPPRFKQIKLTI